MVRLPAQHNTKCIFVLILDGEECAKIKIRPCTGGNAADGAAECAAQVAAADSAKDHSAESKRGSERHIELSTKLVFQEIAVPDVTKCRVLERDDEAAER